MRASQGTATHSVAVSVRIRPGGGAIERSPSSWKSGVTCGGNSFHFPANIIEGSDQAAASAALTGGLVKKFIRGGTSCTLMAYGQTGSGKTYTMFGATGSLTEASLDQAAGGIPALWGAFPRAMMELLCAPELAGATFHASAIEVYMEHAYDLLNARKSVKVGTAKGAGRGNLVVADMSKGVVLSGDVKIVGGVHPSGCSCFECFKKTGGLVGAGAKERMLAKAAEAKKVAEAAKKKPRVPQGLAQAAAASKAASSSDADQFGTEGEELMQLRTPADIAKLARLVESERVAHSHNLNDRSSRSHCLIRVNCTHIDSAGQSKKRLFLFVDLAGSERITKSGVTGERAKEASNINQSLTALGRVVKELNERSSHVSYRDSALTMLLRSSFDGPSCTSVVINCSSESVHAEESVCSLRFGEKLSSVQTSAAVVQATDVGQQRALVGAELMQARTKLAELERAGQGEHIGPNAPPSEQTTLRNNIATLAEREAEVRTLKVSLVEAKSANRPTSDLAAKLSAATAAHETLANLVFMQKGVVGRDGNPLWVEATPAYKRCEAQVRDLASQLEMLGV